MRKVVIAGYRRSPFTLAGKGKLKNIRPDEMVAQVITALANTHNLNTDDIEDVILGCAFPEGEQGLNIGRLAVFLAKLPNQIAGMTVNRFCGSSMQSIHIAAGAIASGAGDVFICGGVESMSRIPMAGFNPLPHPDLFEMMPDAYISMGITAENLASKYNISRKQQDEFSLHSHQKATKAQEAGKFSDEIVDINYAGIEVNRDGCIRPETTLEALEGLSQAFDQNGSVTAGNSSPLTDGAAAVLVCAESYADEHGLPKLARIKSMAVSGCEPGIMGIGPVSATSKALKRADITFDDLDIIELNEAFAVQALSCLQEFGIEATSRKLNMDGGAIAMGHPLGATGARITGKAALLLQREHARYALATQCIGGGQGIATILESI